MRLQDGKQLAAYILVSILAVGGAFSVSLKFVGSLGAQEASSDATIDQSEETSNEASAEPLADPAPTEDADVNARFQPQPPANTGIAELEGFLEPFIYDVANRRDPFLPYAEFIPSEEGPIRALTPAQKYALEELRLVGVMWEVKDPKAMFMDPEDEVLVLGRDESIGNRNGYIAAIREGEVVVVEAIRKRGDIVYRTRVLRIER